MANDIDDKYKVQVLIINCVVAVVLVILIACVIYLFFRLRQLQKLVDTLDPMSKYKKVGTSIYIKRPQRDTSSISLSFKHIQIKSNKSNYPNDAVSEASIEPTNDVGTLDRNYFSRNNFSFENPLSNNNNIVNEGNKMNQKLSKLQRQESQEPQDDAMEAIKSLDKVLY